MHVSVMESSLWKVPWGNQNTVTKHILPLITSASLPSRATRSDARSLEQMHCLAQITGHLLQNMRAKGVQSSAGVVSA